VIPPGLAEGFQEANRLLQEDEPGEAYDTLLALSRDFPDHREDIEYLMVTALRSRGTEAHRQGDYRLAAKSFEEATKLEPGKVLNWIDLGKALRYEASRMTGGHEEQQELLRKSEEALGKALTLAPNDPTALYHLAQVYAALNDRSGAEKTFEKLIENNPESYEAQVAQTNLLNLRRR